MAARGTAQVRRQCGDMDTTGRVRRVHRFHALLDQAAEFAQAGPLHGVRRVTGEALCGALGPWSEPDEGLFAAPLGCERCARIAAAEGITVTGLPEAVPATGRTRR